MPQTRANKVQVPVNSDAYNLTTDLATMADTTNAVVTVASQAERDGLTKVAGLAVTRTDLPGSPIQTCDGTNWATQQVPIVNAATVLAGSPSNLLANLQSGASIPFWQGGTAVVTPDANGFVTVFPPSAFPNGVITYMVCNGDSSITNGPRLIVSTQGTQSTTQIHCRVWDYGANAGWNGTTQGSVRINWIGLGW